MIQIGDVIIHPRGHKATIQSYDGYELILIWYDPLWGFKRETILNPDKFIKEFIRNKRKDLVIAIIKEGNVY